VRIEHAAGSAAIPVRESGDREAEQLARDGPATAVSGVAVERFFGRPKAGLSHVKGDKPAYPHTNTDSHLTVFFEFTGFGGPIPSV